MLTLLVPNDFGSASYLDGVGVVVFLGREIQISVLAHAAVIFERRVSPGLCLDLLLMIVPSILSSWWSMPPALSAPAATVR